MQSPESTEWVEMLKPLILPIMSAVAGIIWRWSDDVRAGRRFTWRRVVVELPSAIGIGFTGHGVAIWLGLPDQAALALCAAFGHLGAQGVIDLLLRFHRGDRSAK